jgi:hypothetical protein
MSGQTAKTLRSHLEGMTAEEIIEEMKMPNVPAGTLTKRGQTSWGFLRSLLEQGFRARAAYRITRDSARANARARTSA